MEGRGIGGEGRWRRGGELSPCLDRRSRHPRTPRAFRRLLLPPPPSPLAPGPWPLALSPQPWSRNNSLTAVFARVLASTRLTITAAYRLWLPSAAGSEPATTTLPEGTRPYETSPLARS